MFSRNQNPNSRIPVPVTRKQSATVYPPQKSVFQKKLHGSFQACIIQDAHPHLQKELVKQSGSQAGKLGVKSDMATGKEMKSKNKALLSEDCKLKSDAKSTKKQLPLKNHADFNDIKHLTALKTSAKYSIGKNKIQSSLKTSVGCDNKIKKQSLIKTNKTYDKKLKVSAINSKCRVAKTTSNNSQNARLLLKTNKAIDNKDKPPTVTVSSHCDDGEKLLTPCNVLTKSCDMPGKQNGFSGQKGIVFEANELYRNMILSGKQPSPSICKQIPGFRLSSIQVQRPSAYQKFEMSADPLKEALDAIKNVRLSAKRMEKSSTKENRIPLSPFKDRGPFYTPCGNPSAEVMKSLEKFKLKRLQKNASKSSKKVTFNLNIQDCTPKDIAVVNSKQNNEKRLTQISEKSEENTPASPQGERTEVLPLKQDNGVRNSSELTINGNNSEHEEPKLIGQIKSMQKDSTIKLEESENSTSQTTCVNSIHPLMVDVKCDKLLQNICKNNSHQNSLTLANKICDSKNYNFEVPASHVKNHYIPVTVQNCVVHKETKSARVYTPQPISLFSKFKTSNSASPDFLETGKSAALAELAPICTPFVLKSIAKQSMVSPQDKPIEDPVRLKLDFTEVEKETPRKETFRNQAAESLKNIITIQKKLDDLADKECSLLMPNENTPIICGRYLNNPIASTLNEGDDMHFIPI